MSTDHHPDYFARHADLLHKAAERTADRGYWTPYPEIPSDSAYGKGAAEQGEAAFRALLDRPFPLDGHPTTGTVRATETSPYGFPLGVSYPHLAPEAAVATAKAAATAWRAASPDTRAGVAAEILARLNAAGFEIAHAVQHTTGQPFVMAFQAGGPHAQDRGLEANARQAAVHTEKAGLNTIVVDSTDDYAGLLRNLAFSLSLYSGQMCTTPQNILVPGDGFPTDQGPRTADEFAADLGCALDDLLADPARAAATLGAIVNGTVLARLEEAAVLGRTAHPSRAVRHPDHPDAVVRTPLVARLDAETDEKTYTSEWFGPVSFVIATDGTAHSLRVLDDTVRSHGALTACVYTTDQGVLAAARATALAAGVHLSENLTGDVFPNQSAAFSDFHGTSANPAANATLTDPAFVHSRFCVLQSRRHSTAEEHDHVR
ncbi:aldehyde dehydrogenase family protein [Streptomyces sp. NPDC005648]|uniref:aldehyde dehydrogenase family protein n=1 Tax=Streptomyces sp. NPDC005648 TaxID=3157044 RepID=UPI0033AC6734